MLLKYETILNLYNFNDANILCLIKLKKKDAVSPNANTCRCILSKEQWQMFDKKLSKLIESKGTAKEWTQDEFQMFSGIRVQIQNTKLEINSFRQLLLETVEENEENFDIKNALYILKCQIEITDMFSTSESQEYNPQYTQTSPEANLSNFTYQPYTPSKRQDISFEYDKVKTPGIEHLNYDSNDDTYSPKPLSITPASDITIAETISPNTQIPEYKPAPIREKRSSISSQKSSDSSKGPPHEVLLTSDDEGEKIISPQKCREIRQKMARKRVSEYVPETIEDIDQIPAYIPTPIQSPEKKLVKKSELKYKEVVQTKSGKTDSSDIFKLKAGRKHLKSSSDRKCSSSIQKAEVKATFDGIAKQKEDMFASMDAPSPANSEEDDFDLSPLKGETSKKTKSENYKKHVTSLDQAAALRRSARSPSKPKRFTEEIISKEPKSVKRKQKSSRNKQLFGTDDDEEEEKEDKLFEAEVKKEDSNNNAACSTSNYSISPKAKSSATSSTSSKKKRKRDKSSECDQKRNTLDKWLGKKKETTSVLADKKLQSSSVKSKKSENKKKSKLAETNNSAESSPSPPPAAEFVVPTKQELDEIRQKFKSQKEHNEKMKAAFENMPASPKKVENLTLKHMSLDDLLNTFSTHKQYLDEIYAKNRKKDYVKSHDGINHCFVIKLVDKAKQLKMLQKLNELYKNESTTLTTLFANAVLPEWIIRIFMEEYRLKRDEAIIHIKAQEDYQLHIDNQNEISFSFD